MISKCLITFASGTIVEGICALWVKAVADKKALKSGIMSIIWATALRIGIGEALHGFWPAATWVLGYGVGSYIAVKLSK